MTARAVARPLLAAALTLLAAPRAARAQYSFIGDLQSVSRDSGDVVATCAPGATVRLHAVTPAIARITLQPPNAQRPTLTWALADTTWPAVATRVDETADAVTLRTDSLVVRLERTGCRVSVLDAGGAELSRDDAGLRMGWEGEEVRVWKEVADDERFYGLGEKTGDVNKRGHEWVMWNSDNFAYAADLDPVYESIPFYVGVRGGTAYGVFLNNSARTAFNLNAGNHRYVSLSADRGPLDYFVIAGPAVSRVVERYTALTGRAPLPPRWALGYQQSRWSYYPQGEVLRLARTFRDKAIPADVLYLDIHYMDGYRVFSWDRERFPAPERMLDTLDRLGFKVVTIVDPAVKEDTTSGYAVAREGLRGDHFVRYPDREVYVGSVWPGRAYFPDFSQATTRRWWGGHLADLERQGVDGIWDDMNEPAVWGKAFPMEVLMDDEGRVSSQRTMHNLYGLLMARAAHEELARRLPDRRPFVLTRAGFAGIQRYAAVWTGDNVASWEHLALSIRMLLGMGLSGIPFTGADVGGFVGTPSPELYARWMEAASLVPLFRSHTTANTADQEPWSFGEEVEDVNRATIERRYRLLPYLYGLQWEAMRTGAPPLRPLFWAFQDDSAAYDPAWQHEFLLGDAVLAAPVVQAAQTSQRVWLPRGRWLELDLARDSAAAGVEHEGGRVVTVDAPLARLPLFLRAGAIIPLQPLAQHTGAARRDTLALDVYPADSSSYLLYEDDGATRDYARGRFRTTRFTVAPEGGAGVRFVRELTADGWDPGARTLVVRLHAIAAPRAVLADGAPLPAGAWRHDAARRVLTIQLPERGRRQELQIR